MVNEVVKEVATEAATRTATDVLDKVIDSLTEATTTITQKLVEISPEALEILLKSLQVQGIVELIGGILSVIVPLMFFLGFIKVWSYYNMVGENTEISYGDKSAAQAFLLVGAGILVVSIILTSISTFRGITNKEAWIKTIYPEAHITLSLFEKIAF